MLQSLLLSFSFFTPFPNLKYYLAFNLRYPFALHEDVRYEKLEDLVAYHGAKSASDYLESLIIKEWEKMQRKLKAK